ncbi:MAG: phosphatidate cytidylyltransferase, partial [Dehalococcoidales bacterium]|nr:phosphatidate cytidylyltransferase [Dehalococcoidales bacterium]
LAIALRLVEHQLVLPLLLVSIIVLPLTLSLFLRDREGIVLKWSWTVGGILYVGWFLGILVALHEQAGREWVFLALFCTFGSDTFAYFIGRAFGRHKLAPRISPGKTWEGTFGGLAGAVLVAWLFTLDHGLQVFISVWQAVLLGFLVSVFGQIGDLAESLLKRTFGVKDSGSLVPGHGGVLDRIDSIVFAGVVVYLFYLIAG